MLTPFLALSFALVAPPPLFDGALAVVPSGSSVAHVVDVNGDGILDALFAGTSPEFQVVAMLGDGTGRFAPATSSAPALDAKGSAIVDWNGDGRIDLIAGGFQLQVLLGDGRGQFTAGPSAALCSIPSKVATADFDADGRPDVAVHCAEQNATQIFLQLPNGGLAAAITVFAGMVTNPQGSLAVGDVDGNGFPDLVMTAPTQNMLAVFGTSAGPSFHLVATYPCPAGVQQALLDDLDGDAVLDLVISAETSIAAWLGNGDGTFAPAPASGTYPASDAPRAATLADVDGDGALDFVGIRRFIPNSNQSSIVVLPGLGDGSFAPAGAAWPVRAGALSVSVADVDRDLLPDIVHGGMSRLGVLAGAPGGGFRGLASAAGAAGAALVDAVAADLDGNGVADVVGASAAGLQFFPGDATGLGAAVLSAAAGSGIQLALGHADGGASLDAFQAITNGWTLSLGLGDGTFGPAALHAITGVVRDIATADLDSDGLDDAVIAKSGSSGAHHVSVFRSAEAYAVEHAYAVGPIGSWPRITLGDLDQDGIADVLIGNFVTPATPLGVLRGDGSGGLLPIELLPAQPSGSFSAGAGLAIADLDGDGRNDIVSTGILAMLVLRNIGTGPALQFSATSYPLGTFSSAAGLSELELADLDANGTLDVVVQGHLNEIIVMSGDGAGAFGAQRRFQSAQTPLVNSSSALAIGDFDADGRLDAATAGLLPFALGVALQLRGAATVEGAGCPGSGGFAPTLALTGAFKPGMPARVAVAQAFGGSAGLLVFGLDPAALPLGGGCSLLTAPLAPTALSLALGGSGAGAGTWILDAPLPATLPLPFTVRLQALLADPGAPAGLTASNAVALQME